MGSMIGFGEISGSLIMNYLSDVIGRRYVMIFGGIIWMVIDTLIIFNGNLTIMLVLCYLSGLFSFSNHVVAYQYAGEVTNIDYKNYAFASIKFGDGSCNLWICL